MKVFLVHPILWSSLLVGWASQSETEANNPDVCQNDIFPNVLHPQNSSVQSLNIEESALEGYFNCLLNPTNILNCSWSFRTLQKDTQVFVDISICDDEGAATFELLTSYHSSEGKVGSRSLSLGKHEMLYVILHFNITLHDKWIVYTYIFDKAMLEVPPPPQNISASVKDGGLLVTWSPPNSQHNSDCFEYQLDIGDQKTPKNLSDQLSYTEPNADPSRTYRVRLRTRVTTEDCIGPDQWSNWSQVVTVEQSAYKINIPVMISISLGIPMILLAVLLLVCHQRVSKVLFPPIPRPPPKYKYFLEKFDTFSLHPAPSAEPEAEITEVEDTEQNPGKTF